MNKPGFLYHGSENRMIEEFEPRERTVRDAHEGPVVFASPEPAMAACFIVRTRMECGRFGNTFYYAADRDAFADADKGGAIYTLPADGFEGDPEKGMGGMEWVSKKSVRPIGKKEYRTALEAMLEGGVQVYLTDIQTLDAISAAEDHGLSALRGLASENEKRGLKVKRLGE